MLRYCQIKFRNSKEIDESALQFSRTLVFILQRHAIKPAMARRGKAYLF